MQPLSPAFIDQLRFNEVGLIPAISQDWLDGAVLMMAWMNRTALEQTLKSGEVHYRHPSAGEETVHLPAKVGSPVRRNSFVLRYDNSPSRLVRC
jgi:hypothetical protein